MNSRGTSPTNNNDPRVHVLRSRLLKAEKDALMWSETSAQWKASAERRLIRACEQQKRCQELETELEETKKELEQTRKRQREEVTELELKHKRVAEAVMKTIEETLLGQREA